MVLRRERDSQRHTADKYLRLYYSFEDNDLGLRDYSGARLNATLLGTQRVEDHRLSGTRFNGSNTSYARLQNVPHTLHPLWELAIEVWFKVRGPGNWGASLFQMGNSFGLQLGDLWTGTPQSQAYFFVYLVPPGAWWDGIFTNGLQLNDGNVHQLVAVKRADRVIIYADGLRRVESLTGWIAGLPFTLPIIYDDDDPLNAGPDLYLGKDGLGRHNTNFNGDIFLSLFWARQTYGDRAPPNTSEPLLSEPMIMHHYNAMRSVLGL